MGIPWLLRGALGVVPRGGHSGLPFAGGHTSVKPALPNEDPALVQGTLPQNKGHPCPLLPAPVDGSLCQGVGGLPCQLVGMFSPLVGMVRHLCRRPSLMANGSFTHPPGRAGKFLYPCRIIGSTPGNLPSGSWEEKAIFPSPGLPVRRCRCGRSDNRT